MSNPPRTLRSFCQRNGIIYNHSFNQAFSLLLEGAIFSFYDPFGGFEGVVGILPVVKNATFKHGVVSCIRKHIIESRQLRALFGNGKSSDDLASELRSIWATHVKHLRDDNPETTDEMMLAFALEIPAIAIQPSSRHSPESFLDLPPDFDEEEIFTHLKIYYKDFASDSTRSAMLGLAGACACSVGHAFCQPLPSVVCGVVFAHAYASSGLAATDFMLLTMQIDGQLDPIVSGQAFHNTLTRRLAMFAGPFRYFVVRNADWERWEKPVVWAGGLPD